MGVGSFVFSQGVVSAIPILKNPAYLTGPVSPKLVSAIKKVVPLLFLGIVRLIMVKGTEYPVRHHCRLLISFISSPFSGTRDRVRDPLELLFHSGAPSGVANSTAPCDHPPADLIVGVRNSLVYVQHKNQVYLKLTLP